MWLFSNALAYLNGLLRLVSYPFFNLSFVLSWTDHSSFFWSPWFWSQPFSSHISLPEVLSPLLQQTLFASFTQGSRKISEGRTLTIEKACITTSQKSAFVEYVCVSLHFCHWLNRTILWYTQYMQFDIMSWIMRFYKGISEDKCLWSVIEILRSFFASQFKNFSKISFFYCFTTLWIISEWYITDLWHKTAIIIFKLPWML